MLLKRCSKCGLLFPATPEYFYRNSKASDGLRCDCKICQQKRYKIYYDNKHKLEKEAKEKQENELKFQGIKVCSKCGKKFPATNEYFYPMKDRKDGLSNWCKECSKEWTKKYRIDNYDLILKRSKEHYAKIKDNIEYKNKRKQWDKNRNQKQKFSRSFSSAMYSALKNNKAGRHWEELVPYTLDQLRQHLESQFTSEMNWDNYGSYWEIDHIIPQNLFKYSTAKDKEFQICWSLYNLRPLEKYKNRQRPKDGSDISEEIKRKIINFNI